MRVIGITGGVGSGKSLVLNYLAEKYDSRVVKADEVGHLLMRPGKQCYQPVIDVFGVKIVNEDGTLNRKAIAEIAFSEPIMLKRLNRIIHPAVKEYIKSEIRKAREDEIAYFFVEAALLIEDGYGGIYDELWGVYCEETVRQERLQLERGYTKEHIDSLIKNQLSPEEYEAHCDFMIYNSEDREHTYLQIDRRMRTYEIM